MPSIKSYKDMTVEVLAATPYPQTIVGLAQGLTMGSTDVNAITSKQARFLVDAEHTSLFEHVVYTFLIQGMSRSLLAQITRQRTASPTSGSQHYQDYSSYPCVVHEELIENEHMQHALAQGYHGYASMLLNDIAREEARQCLPNAAAVNYLWTIDARNLFFFLRQRLCNRNVTEMRVLAFKVLSLAQDHFPELFLLAGPQCFREKCKQGFLQCEEKTWVNP